MENKKKLGITEGEWNPLQTDKVDNHLDIAINANNDCIAWVYSDSTITDRKEESEANAKLISDAGTTANKCGKLPSELLKERDELLSTIKEAKSTLEMWSDKAPAVSLIQDIEKLIQSIEK